jgi:hypothetical protein
MREGMFASLTFGTSEPIEVVRDALAKEFGLDFRTGDSDYRGGIYYEHPSDLAAPPYAEHWYVQTNADMGDIAEEEWPDVPTLLYIEATTMPDERAVVVEGVARLHLLRREDWRDPRLPHADAPR